MIASLEVSRDPLKGKFRISMFTSVFTTPGTRCAVANKFKGVHRVSSLLQLVRTNTADTQKKKRRQGTGEYLVAGNVLDGHDIVLRRHVQRVPDKGTSRG